MSAKSKALGQIPALDGLRGIAILAVMIHHFGLFGEMTADRFVDAAYRGGPVVCSWCGVDLFFVLSGFLITGIILDTKTSPHFFRNFYARRFLRIFPLYYGFLALYFFVVARSLPGLTGEKDGGGQVWYWTYTSNILSAHKGYLDSGISHFWSLAVEEQFYLVWPLVVYLLPRGALLRTSVALLFASFALRVTLVLFQASFAAYYTLTPCRFDALAAGAIVSLLVRGEIGLAALARFGRWVATIGAFVLAVLMGWRRGLHAHDHVVATLGYSVFALTFAGLVAAAVGAPAGSRLVRGLSHRSLRFFGRYSYAMYVFHHPLAYALQHARIVVSRFPRVAGMHLPAVLGLTAVGIAATVLASLTSWHLLEAPFLRFKRHFEYRAGRSVGDLCGGEEAATETS